jgi:hypothetical protein
MQSGALPWALDSEELPQAVRAQPGVAQDPGKGPLPQFLVERTTSACRRPGFFSRT